MTCKWKFKEGDKVVHLRDSSWIGTVTTVDRNFPDPTTVIVRWDEPEYDDSVIWTNMLNKV